MSTIREAVLSRRQGRLTTASKEWPCQHYWNSACVGNGIIAAGEKYIALAVKPPGMSYPTTIRCCAACAAQSPQTSTGIDGRLKQYLEIHRLLPYEGGPWARDGLLIYNPHAPALRDGLGINGAAIARVIHSTDTLQALATAQLLVHAPEMMDTLERVATECETGDIDADKLDRIKQIVLSTIHEIMGKSLIQERMA